MREIVESTFQRKLVLRDDWRSLVEDGMRQLRAIEMLSESDLYSFRTKLKTA
ncbi:MAG: hypothetical protein ACKVQU_25970 [Burkholderiales bacterium]